MKHLVLAILALSIAACGVPKEKHKSALDRIKKLEAELSAERKAWDENKSEYENKQASLEGENRVMKKKLLSLGQDLSKLKTEAGQMVQNLTQKDKEIADLKKAQAAAKKRAEQYRKLVESFQKMIDAGKLNVGIRNGRMVVQMSDKILFASGKANLKKDGEAALVEIANILKSIANRNFQIAGHTDNIPIRTKRFRSNWELSTARAVAVVKFMANSGMDPKRLSAAGYAEQDPVGDNETKEGRQLNRRIEITLMPSIDELPSIKQ